MPVYKGIRRVRQSGLLLCVQSYAVPSKLYLSSRAPLERFLASALISCMRFYQLAISPHMPRNCRFVPTCSDYAVEAIQTLGVTKGIVVTAWRVMRCNPFGGRGYDPVKWPPVGWNAGT